MDLVYFIHLWKRCFRGPQLWKTGMHYMGFNRAEFSTGCFASLEFSTGEWVE